MDIPGLIVFDLDFTLWDCGGRWIDCTAWPFRSEEGRVFDRQDSEFHLYANVRDILSDLEEQDCDLALASRTSQPSWATWLLEEWNLTGKFRYQEIYPGSKVEHFQRLSEQSGLAFSEMLFFDDEERNIVEVGELGVTAIHVTSGVSHEHLQAGLQQWKQNS